MNRRELIFGTAATVAATVLPAILPAAMDTPSARFIGWEPSIVFIKPPGGDYVAVLFDKWVAGTGDAILGEDGITRAIYRES